MKSNEVWSDDRLRLGKRRRRIEKDQERSGSRDEDSRRQTACEEKRNDRKRYTERNKVERRKEI
jgi:hypothetical protein